MADPACNKRQRLHRVPPLSDDLVRCVVSFVRDRETRSIMGYSWDTCLKWKIPPARLCIDPAFKKHLNALRQRWLRHGVVWDSDDGLVRIRLFVREDSFRMACSVHTGPITSRVRRVYNVTWDENYHFRQMLQIYHNVDAHGRPALFTTDYPDGPWLAHAMRSCGCARDESSTCPTRQSRCHTSCGCRV